MTRADQAELARAFKIANAGPADKPRRIGSGGSFRGWAEWLASRANASDGHKAWGNEPEEVPETNFQLEHTPDGGIEVPALEAV